MKNKFTIIIITIIKILIIGVFVLFGVIVFQEIQRLQIPIEAENFQTVFSDTLNTINDNIEIAGVIDNSLNDIKGENNNTENIDYRNVNVDKYFYNQLEEDAKTIYKAFESNKENMKTGTYKVALGDVFTTILESENGRDQLGKYYQSAIEAYFYDNPEIFYLSPDKMYLNIETTTYRNKNTYNVYIDNGNESNYLVNEFSSKEQVDQAIKTIEEIKNQVVSNRTGNTYKDIKMVHDYLVENTEYDQSISQPNIYNVYGTLVNHVAVCEGYARSFKYMMDELQIPCVLVIGKATNSQGQTENHAWNYVQVGEKWYAIDTTWDDPVISGGWGISNSSKYKYFLKGNNYFSQDHIPSGQFTTDGKVFEYPVISSQDL